jgi:oxepin-CoA hydrolase/3-oxo-5,6-dehydrosuberyl-CoA semialdehyde dehydrogenase
MLVSSVYSDRREFLRDVAFGIAPHCGRVVLVDSKAEGHSLPSGMVLPQLIHGGPGRAGGGEELGGRRGIEHYMQRVAVQGMAGVMEQLAKGRD